MKRINETQIGNVKITLVMGEPPKGESKRLDWDLPKGQEIDCGLEQSIWLLEAALSSEWGVISDKKYYLYTNAADPESMKIVYNRGVMVEIPQQCECDFDTLRGILNTLWDIVYTGYMCGYQDGKADTEYELKGK